jgi:hypothetical protein
VRKIFFGFIAVISIVFIGILATYFFFRTEMKKHLIPETQKLLKDTTDLNITFSDFEFSLVNLLKLEPSLVIKDLKVENAITAKKLTASLYLTELLARKFKIKNFEVDNAVMNFTQNYKGEIELTGLNKKSKQKTTKETKAKQEQAKEALLEEIELKNFEISDSHINLKLKDLPETIKFNNFNLKLSDFKLDKEERLTTKLNLDSKLFNSTNCSIDIDGILGPIDSKNKSLPINVNQKIKLKISSIPESILKKNLGELIQVSDASIIEEAKLKGDFLATSTGQGSLKIENLELGKTKQESLHLNSSFPISYKLKNKYTPTLSVSTDNSEINIKSKENDSGKLAFDADIVMNLKSGFINGNSSGNITGINVKNILHALTGIRNVVSGDLYLENYNVSFNGSRPEYLFKSAKGTAQIELKNGSIYILDSITKYKNIADQVLQGLGTSVSTEKLSGKFKTFKSDLKLENKILYCNNIDIEASEEQVKINGNGKVKNLQWLVYDINLDVPKLEPIPLSIRGSIESPKIYPNVKNISKKQSQQLLNSFIHYGLNSLNKTEPAKTTGTEAGTTEAAAQAAPSKKQSFGSFLKDTLKDNLKDGLLEQKAPAEEAPVATPEN